MSDYLSKFIQAVIAVALVVWPLRCRGRRRTPSRTAHRRRRIGLHRPAEFRRRARLRRSPGRRVSRPLHRAETLGRESVVPVVTKTTRSICLRRPRESGSFTTRFVLVSRPHRRIFEGTANGFPPLRMGAKIVVVSTDKAFRSVLRLHRHSQGPLLLGASLEGRRPSNLEHVPVAAVHRDRPPISGSPDWDTSAEVGNSRLPMARARAPSTSG